MHIPTFETITDVPHLVEQLVADGYYYRSDTHHCSFPTFDLTLTLYESQKDALYNESSCGAISLRPRSFVDPDTDVVIRYVRWTPLHRNFDIEVVGCVEVNDATKAEFRELLIFLIQNTADKWLRKETIHVLL
jgi:hypothetical protein